LEELLREAAASELEQAADAPGTYVISVDRAIVGEFLAIGPPPYVGELPRGTVVEVKQVASVGVGARQRLRGRICAPLDGWISLLNIETGVRLAERQLGDGEAGGSGRLLEFDAKFQTLSEELMQKEKDDPALVENQQENDALGFERKLSRVKQDLLQTDLLYLSVVRRYLEQKLPVLPTFIDPLGKTWAMSGTGLERWQAVAGDSSYNVHLEPVRGEFRLKMRQTILNGNEDYGVLLNEYLSSARTGSVRSGSFSSFIQRFDTAKTQLMQNIGGSLGPPERTKTDAEEKNEPADEASAEARQQHSKEWLPWFAMILQATRVSQADVYFGHALFGMCLRRLQQRYYTLQNMGDVQDFESFVEAFAELDEDGQSSLNTLLAMSPGVLATLRKQAEFLFGKGLPDELAGPMDASNRACQSGMDSADRPMEVTCSFILEAANSGDLRMVSFSDDSKERMVWDAVLFGTLLQE